MMVAEEVTSGNVKDVEWDENYFKFCTFSGLDVSGHVVASDFNRCNFESVYWYWGLFTQTNFIDCNFVDCTFAGSSFADVRFVACKLSNCKFIKDNLDRSCDFEDTVAYGCSVANCIGFNVPPVQS